MDCQCRCYRMQKLRASTPRGPVGETPSATPNGLSMPMLPDAEATRIDAARPRRRDPVGNPEWTVNADATGCRSYAHRRREAPSARPRRQPRMDCQCRCYRMQKLRASTPRGPVGETPSATPNGLSMPMLPDAEATRIDAA